MSGIKDYSQIWMPGGVFGFDIRLSRSLQIGWRMSIIRLQPGFAGAVCNRTQDSKTFPQNVPHKECLNETP
jgi:hypothetical protein